VSGERRHVSGRAYRDERLVCGCVRLTIGRDDDRVGLARQERGRDLREVEFELREIA
jgi:hypothetical protein